MLQQYLSEFPYEKRDLTSVEQNLKVLTIASRILSEYSSNVLSLEKELCDDSDFVSNANPVFLEALKSAVAKYLIQQTKVPFHITVVWAMYKETARLQSKENNVHGEDCLRAKVSQMTWLFEGLDDSCSWNVVACDDGCPEMPSSSQVAQEIIKSEQLSELVSVVRLQTAINEGVNVNDHFSKIKTTSDSRKGGSILLGMHHALITRGKELDSNKKHVIVYTDADLSANLCQIGSLVHPIIQNKKSCALGQRYGINRSILVKSTGATIEPQSTKEQPGKQLILFRNFVKATLIPSLEKVVDTQAGFKAIDANALKSVLPKMRSFQELFDIELLIHLSKLYGSDSLVLVPILFTEDFALTNFPSLNPGEGHLNMIRQIITIYDQLIASEQPASEDLLLFLKSMPLADFTAMMQTLKKLDNEDERLFDRRWTLAELRSYCIAGKNE